MSLEYDTNGIARLPASEFHFHSGDKVSAITSFYGGRQKAIIIDGPFYDRFMSRTFYKVRITSHIKIYGGYDRGTITTVSNHSLSARKD